jgi:glycosyltransferase involved in cell wall biosynthesis
MPRRPYAGTTCPAVRSIKARGKYAARRLLPVVPEAGTPVKSHEAGVGQMADGVTGPIILPEMRVTMLVRNPFTHDARVEREARTLVEAGHRVVVIAEGTPPEAAREGRQGYEVVRVGRPLGRIPFLRFVAYRQRMVHTLVATRPDVLHAHDADSLEPVGAAARRLRVPFVYDAHELWLKQLRRGRSRAYWSAFIAYYALIERLYAPRAAAAVTVSAPIAAYLEHHYHRQFELIPNYPEVGPDLIRHEIRALPGTASIPAEAPIVLRLGGLTPGRGVEQLVAAMVDVPHAHLVFLGAGPLTGAVVSEAGELGIGGRVHVLAPVPEEEVVGYAASAAVGVSPAIATSLNDAYSLPNKLFQYMAAGIPVVASDFKHLQEIVVTPGAGILADMRRPATLAAALNAILGDTQRAREMGANARRAVLTTFNWASASQTLLAIYRRLEDSAGARSNRAGD